MKKHKCFNDKCKNTTMNPKFCSNECKIDFHKRNKTWIFNPIVKQKIADTNRKNGTGFFDKEIQSKGGKIGVKTCKEKSIGLFDPKVREMGRIAANEYSKENTLGFYNPDLRKENLKKQKENKIGLFSDDHAIQKLGGKTTVKKCRKSKTGIFSEESRNKLRNVLKTREISKEERRIHSQSAYKMIDYCRINKKGTFFNPELNRMVRINQSRNMGRWVFNDLYFDSRAEMEFGLNINYQIEKLVNNKNFQFIVKRCHYDFYIKKYDCFIEFHPYNPRYDKNDKMLKVYYEKRRRNLNINGYENSKLYILK